MITTPSRSFSRLAPLLRRLTLLALLAACVGAWAQAMVPGEVRRVDKAGGRITIQHGAIQHLELPAMSMTYRVAQPAMLDQVQAGDQVRFVAERIKGTFTLTRIEK